MAAPMVGRVLVFLVLVFQVYCWIPRFINGRPRGGMLGAPNVPKGTPTPPPQWFEMQRLDHFDGTNNKHWRQGAWIVYAKQFGAIAVMLEHRYYGESHPVPDLSVENLRFLSSRQALADLAEFIDYFRVKRKLPTNKLISFGGSYPVLQSMPKWISQGAIGTDITLDTLCGIMNDFTRGTPLQRYADVNTLIMKTYGQKCLDYTYTKMISDMRQTDWKSGAGRQWMYQTCAEFGWYQSSDFSKQPFSFLFPLNYSLVQCQDIYNKSLDASTVYENVRDTNRYYGGRGIAITKVVFPNGSIDPWHAMGVTQNISSEATAIYIEGTAHCANMYPARDQDPQQLTDARTKISSLIGSWLQTKS
ncbi:TSSP-like protein [Mya arenaria]|uniref:TSSP-like protein n=1 Tax=Mya arenaria TaxID=6604 RepID=A0ABY7ET24_MYAAR|nr:TSSP-like protein [Mya arenaria]